MRTKIDYGIDLGTTNSAISRMENGEIVIKKTDRLKDTMPSCIFVNKKKTIEAGDSAFNSLKRTKLSAMKNWDEETNAFIEFKRTMGTDKTYYSPAFGKEFSSEELSAEVLKALKSFIKDENINAAVITIPAAFKNNQIDATRRAAKLAGIEHIEVLQEPVAAATAYGLENNNKDGFWLVFDFGGGTFDAALLKVEDGIMKVTDTEGDNYLGGKNLDFAIVDEIILPYLQQHYDIDSILADDEKKQILRNAMKFYAEETKIALSFNATHNILSDLGDIPGEDDNGEEFELDITVTQSDLEKVFAPIFQKAIDICKTLLKRNSMTGADLATLILVGGPTFSPILRSMLEKQICKPDTSVDPMTVVSKGAALYASTVDISENVKEQSRDRLKIQLDISHETSSVELEEYVTVRILEDKTDGDIPDEVFAEITRQDNAWSSGKVKLHRTGEVIETQLVAGKNNGFEVILYDNKGNILASEPKNFNIIQGMAGINSMQVLPYNFGIEVQDRITGKRVFTQIQGLERNKSLPVTGTRNGLKTQQAIRPGMEQDFITIPLYQGEHSADRTRAEYNEHVYDVVISGLDLPALLPENSDVDLTISLDRSQKIVVQAYFPYLDHTAEINIPERKQSIENEWLEEKIEEAKSDLFNLRMNNHSPRIDRLNDQLNQVENDLENNPNDIDNKQKVLSDLRKVLKELDTHLDQSDWEMKKQELDELFEKIKHSAQKVNDASIQQSLRQFEEQIQDVNRSQDIKLADKLLEAMRSLDMQINLVEYIVGFICYADNSFDEIHWFNRTQARRLVDIGLRQIHNNDDINQLHQTVAELINLMPRDEIENSPQNNSSILIG
ncbi:Hsp70 family protein [Lonepinella sp. BR2357]|uniref:Hsp70 family protein n=1 Tax=Lonepinella sp. BR2357 TaxID=3434549 RepID=UPI003F6DD249